MKFENLIQTKLNNLVDVTRYSGYKFIFPESVSDHLTSMRNQSILIKKELNEAYPEVKFDIKELFYRIDIHDLDESLLCDIPRSLKYYNPNINREINIIYNNLIDNYFDKELSADIKNSKNIDNIYGFMVKILDVTQASLKLYNEVFQLGNKNLLKITIENYTYLLTIKKILSEKMKEIKDNSNDEYKIMKIMLTYMNCIIKQIKKCLIKKK